MARPRYALAKQEADKLLKWARVEAPADIDVDALAKRCGAIVRREPYGRDDMAGALVREPGRQPIIGVNASDTPERQRFTIAHELGHLILHNEQVHVDTKMFMRDSRSSTAESIMEIEANQFAANLLMPAWLLEADLNNELEVDMHVTTQKLATAYRVSVQAMTLRMAKLMKYGL